MSAIEPHLAGLSEEHRRVLDSWLVEFDQSWDEEQLRNWLRKLPAAGDPLRLPVLIELVAADIQRRLRRGDRVDLKAYMNQFPELVAAGDESVGRIRSAYEQRGRHQADVILQLVDLSDGDLASSGSGGGGTAAAPSGLPSLTPDRGRARGGDLKGQFGRYEVIKKLGACGMGTVYLVRDGVMGRDVALKVPHSSPDDATVRARFEQEAKAAAELSHKNICPVYDFGVIDGRCFLTMRYVEGRPLSEWVRGGKAVAPARAAALVRTLAEALQYCHARGVIHRDLKPANVMMPEEEGGRVEPVVIDFGIALRTHTAGPRLTASDKVVGTPDYMAPEQLTGDPVGPAADIYSLGVIFYQLLTGRLPTSSLFGAPERPGAFTPGLPRRFEDACLKARATKPEDRFGSMAEFAQALADEPFPPRWRGLAAGGVCLLLAVLVGWFTLGGEMPPPPPPRPPLALQWSGFAQGERGGVWADLQFKDGVTLLSGEQYKLVLCPSEDCHLYVVGVDRTGPSLLFPHKDIPHLNPCRGKTDVHLPDVKWYTLDEITGTETLYVVASREPLPDLEGHVRANAVERLEGLVRELEKKSSEQLKTRGQTIQPDKRVVSAQLDSGEKGVRVMDVTLGGDVVVQRIRFEHSAPRK